MSEGKKDYFEQVAIERKAEMDQSEELMATISEGQQEWLDAIDEVSPTNFFFS